MKVLSAVIATANSACTGSESFDDAVTTCSPNQMTINIPSCAFTNARMDAAGAYLAGVDFNSLVPDVENNCTGTFDADADNWVFELIDDISECGSVVVNNGTFVTYSNAVQSTVGTENVIITRKRDMKVGFSCAFPLEVTLSAANAINPVLTHFELDLGSEEGTFDVQMGLYSDSSFSTIVDSSFTVNIPDDLNVAISIADETDMVTVLETCWATPSADPNDVVSYTFLDAKCGSNDELNVYQSLEVQANGVDRSSTFSIESFNFQGEEGGDIFLHCDVQICDPNQEVCEPDCSGVGSRRRRRSASSDEHVLVVLGPIYVGGPK